MGIFTRVRDIISSNINAMLDSAEDPEKLVRLMIQEMEDTLVEIKASCAGAMAQKKKVERQLEQLRGHVQDWSDKAELAVRKNREDLAREALVEKRRLAERVDTLEAELAQAEDLIEQYQSDIEQLEAKLQTARDKQRMLVQRHVHAQGKKRAQQEMRRFDTSDAMLRFDKFEQRIDRMEADADLVNHGRKPDLRERFAAIETDDEIEQQLAELKARQSQSQY